jgi:hypothetical protein
MPPIFYCRIENKLINWVLFRMLFQFIGQSMGGEFPCSPAIFTHATEEASDGLGGPIKQVCRQRHDT